MPDHPGSWSWLAPSLRGFEPSWLRRDVLAGLTVWAVLVPESLAYATIAGVPPVVGLYAAVPALLLYLLFGSSRHLVVGPMSGTAVLSAGIVAGYAPQGAAEFMALTAALAVVVGLLGLVAGLLRFGFLTSLISEPVLKGFMIGLTLSIIVRQLPDFFGIEPGSGDFFERLWDLVAGLGGTNLSSLGIGALSLAIVLVLRRWLPLAPGALIAVVIAILVGQLVDLQARGVALVGEIEPGLPSIGLPDVPLETYLELVGPAVGVLLVGLAQGLAAAKAYAAKNGYEVDPNAELLGMGSANLGSGFASGMIVNGSLSKTAVNGGAGAKSQLSSVTAAVLTVFTLLFLTGLFQRLPEPTLAAIVIAAVIELVDVAALRRLFRVSSRRLAGIYGAAARADFVSAIVALLGVLVFGTLAGLAIGIATSLLLLLYRSSRPHLAVLARSGGSWVDVERHPGASTVAGVVVVRVESGLFFANADHVRRTVEDLASDDVRAVVLDAQTVPFLDVTAAAMLAVLRDQLAGRGVTLLLARDVGQVRDVLRRTDEGHGPAVYPDVDEAVAAMESDGGTGQPS